jgi:hypothetical protein
MGDKTTDAIGTALAGSLIATSLFRALVEKEVISTAEGSSILNRALNAVKDSSRTEDQAAFRVLTEIYRQLHA